MYPSSHGPFRELRFSLPNTSSNIWQLSSSLSSSRVALNKLAKDVPFFSRTLPRIALQLTKYIIEYLATVVITILTVDVAERHPSNPIQLLRMFFKGRSFFEVLLDIFVYGSITKTFRIPRAIIPQHRPHLSFFVRLLLPPLVTSVFAYPVGTIMQHTMLTNASDDHVMRAIVSRFGLGGYWRGFSMKLVQDFVMSIPVIIMALLRPPAPVAPMPWYLLQSVDVSGG
eukprot:TRINITY_DN7955_c0_g1_i2.p1 TRINITY_DN7955_c0_g1~~TRINITY_DN7955_c0_g1_i2.p1  ORF type:complete len:227 (-),score=23.42 TRINITY_DN7955_c0_g1_i2:212-892(-)